MLPIKKIVIPCYWKDVWLARICVASIRYWYPDIQICLMKDVSSSQFDTADFESYWNVTVREYPHQPLGLYTKLYSIIEPQRERILLLDSDTILMGPILKKLEECEEDFVVNWNRGNVPLTQAEREAHATDNYHQLDALKKHFPDYELPDVFFNAGQMVVTTGILKWEDFTPYMTDTYPPEEKYPGALMCHDQGILNYLLTTMNRKGHLTLGSCPFVQWAHHREEMQALELEKLQSKEGYPFLIHWVGFKDFYKARYERGDLLGFFEDMYYARIPQGNWIRRNRLGRRFRKALKRLSWNGKLAKKYFNFRTLIRIDEAPAKYPQPDAYLRPTGFTRRLEYFLARWPANKRQSWLHRFGVNLCQSIRLCKSRSLAENIRALAASRRFMWMRITQWKNNLHGFYFRWINMNQRYVNIQQKQIHDFQRHEIEGFHQLETIMGQAFCWSDGYGQLSLRIPQKNHSLYWEFPAFCRAKDIKSRDPVFTINSHSLAPENISWTRSAACLQIPAQLLHDSDTQILSFTVPPFHPGGSDRRALGLPLFQLWVCSKK